MDFARYRLKIINSMFFFLSCKIAHPIRNPNDDRVEARYSIFVLLMYKLRNVFCNFKVEGQLSTNNLCIGVIVTLFMMYMSSSTTAVLLFVRMLSHTTLCGYTRNF